ncbi:exo-alpha-sialidase [Pararhizobium arenae]|uniref:exo-alpha-sialidase n=1 Tax=Pararhizobium arenae TaxID=1856850 RepID=UPI00094AF938|nr:exo-alpha-sialidase [Pararhizobium arenae]
MRKLGDRSGTQKPTNYFATRQQGDNADIAVRKAQRDWPQIPFGSSLISNEKYSHFPVLAASSDRIGVAYYMGENHGGDEDNCICLSQTANAGGVQNLVLNGRFAAEGVKGSTQIRFTSSGNDSGITVTITGFNKDQPVTLGPFACPNAGVIDYIGLITKVTQVQLSGNAAGTVKVGLRRLPSNLMYKSSPDGGKTWPNIVTIGDGITDGQHRHNYPALGARKDGSLILCYVQQDIEDGRPTHLQRTSIFGDEFSEATEMVITGDMPSGSPIVGDTFSFYGQIKRTPSGRLLLYAYQAADNFVLTSDDDGATWVSKIQITSSSPALSETSLLVQDEANWLSISRIDAAVGALYQMKTVNGGDTWTTQGQTNLVASGGYLSQELVMAYVDGIAYAVMLYMCRDTSINPDPPNPNTICLRWARMSDLLASPLAWGPEEVVITGVNTRSGYPSMFINPNTGTMIVAYGVETGGTAANTAEVRSVAIDIIQRIKARQFLGTVSQSGGRPTGDIVETGQNENGSYIRWSCGYQECSKIVDLTDTAIATASGGLFTSAANLAWTYPKPFSSQPVFNGALQRGVVMASGNPAPATKLSRMNLGGLAAETLVLGEFTEAVAGDRSSDLGRATELATKLEACFGMGRTLAIDIAGYNDVGRLRASDDRLRKAVDDLLESQFTRAKEILDLRHNALLAIAEELLGKKVMSVTEVKEALARLPTTSKEPVGLDTADPNSPQRGAPRPTCGL